MSTDWLAAWKCVELSLWAPASPILLLSFTCRYTIVSLWLMLMYWDTDIFLFKADLSWTCSLQKPPPNHTCKWCRLWSELKQDWTVTESNETLTLAYLYISVFSGLPIQQLNQLLKKRQFWEAEILFTTQEQRMCDFCEKVFHFYVHSDSFCYLTNIEIHFVKNESAIIRVNNLSFKSFFKQKCQMFDGSRLSDVKMCCFYLSYIIVKLICLRNLYTKQLIKKFQQMNRYLKKSLVTSVTLTLLCKDTGG